MYPHPLFCLEIVDEPFFTSVTVVAQDEALNSELHPVSRPQLKSFLCLARLAMFVIDRGNGAVVDFNEIHASDCSVTIAGHAYRTRAQIVVVELIRRRKGRGNRIDTLVLRFTFKSVGVFLENSNYPFIEE